MKIIKDTAIKSNPREISRYMNSIIKIEKAIAHKRKRADELEKNLQKYKKEMYKRMKHKHTMKLISLKYVGNKHISRLQCKKCDMVIEERE